jgi:predicted thioredoxin/glutaredoxin
MAWTSLWTWWRRRREPPLRDLRLVLYTRQGCHLCELALERLRAAQQRYGFQIEEADVNTDGEWLGLYGDQVPVVAVEGKVYFRGAVNPVLLERLLHAAARRRTGRPDFE